MKRASTIVLGLALTLTLRSPSRAEDAPLVPGDPSAASAAAEESVAAPDSAGREIVDHAGSAKRTKDLEHTAPLPEIFIHQWVYHEPRITNPSGSGDQDVARLTLAESVQAALQHNPGVAAQRLTPIRAEQDVRVAESAFDPDLLADANKSYSIAPNSSALSGVLHNINQNYNWDVTLKKLLRTGANFEVDWTNNRLVSNAHFQGLVPQYQPELLFSLNQPLLRNFGSNFAYLLVDITNITSQEAQYNYRAQLADFVKTVVVAYWNVVNARETLAVRQKSLALAQQTLKENNERVRVGLLAPVAVTEARSQEAAREADVIVAENAVEVAEQTLRQTVYLHRDVNELVPRRIDPVESLRTDPVEINADQALAVALERRPEVVAQNLDVHARNLTARVRENAVLPRLDAVASVGLNGLSGDAVTVTVNGQPVQTPFTGDYGKSLDRLTSGDFYSYSAGVVFEMPLGNENAKALYAQAKIDAASSELNRRQLLSNVTLEVQRAVSDVVTNMKRLRATHLATELAQQNLNDQQRRLEVGMATTKDILDFQDQLTTARGNEVQAQTDYNVSLAELARSQGTLLDQYSVVVEVPGKHFTPWWARF
jgi:outer membrane protein TolC